MERGLLQVNDRAITSRSSYKAENLANETVVLTLQLAVRKEADPVQYILQWANS